MASRSRASITEEKCYASRLSRARPVALSRARFTDVNRPSASTVKIASDADSTSSVYRASERASAVLAHPVFLGLRARCGHIVEGDHRPAVRVR